MRREAAAIGISVLLLTLSSARTLAQQSSTADGIEQILNRLYTAASEYRAAFKNLVTEEIRTIEVLDADGNVDKRRQIVADLVVYSPSRGDAAQAAEYRDTREVDGKAVKDRSERTLKLLMAASQADSLERELKIINNETRKHEFRAHINGFTVNLATPFKEHRDFFHVELNGRESIGGRDVAVVVFRQTAPIPGARRSRLPGFPEQPSLQQGRIWLDAETGQVRRTELEYTVVQPSFPQRVPYVRVEQEYVPSTFGILVPQRVVFSAFGHLRRPKNSPPTLALRERSTFTYGSFKQFGVTSEEVFATPGRP